MHTFVLDLWSFSSLRPFGGGSNLVVRPPLLILAKEWMLFIMLTFHQIVQSVNVCMCIQGVCLQSVKAYLKYLWLKLRQANSIYHFPAQNGRRKCMVMVDNMGYVSDMGRPSTFTNDQMVNIVLLLGKLKNVFKVWRKFAKHYGIACHSRKILPSDPSKQSSTTSVRLHLTWRISDVLWPMWGSAWQPVSSVVEDFEHLLKKAKNEAAEEKD